MFAQSASLDVLRPTLEEGGALFPCTTGESVGHVTLCVCVCVCVCVSTVGWMCTIYVINLKPRVLSIMAKEGRPLENVMC